MKELVGFKNNGVLARRQGLNLQSPDYEPSEITSFSTPQSKDNRCKRVNPTAGSPTVTLLRLRSGYQTVHKSSVIKV